MTKKIMHNPPHPGEIIKQVYLDQLQLTVTKAARAMNVTRKTLSSIINGKSGISPAMAIRLSKAFNTTPQLWMNLQQSYDLLHAQNNIDISKVETLRATG
ncbi:MAG: HigA family addiction module antidote protein [Candidatus Dadabacteria bacterium]|nr:HigA family addiction module antidote protein [Candidatus Dadabacteria bacterium]NIX15550.1 HigA family addiction module antidote protein [Candidatus Dadabacteria bacterium]NIY22290.1 HigA family addiction module antidote protein [Candidatus Dadabacteria bacterium]